MAHPDWVLKHKSIALTDIIISMKFPPYGIKKKDVLRKSLRHILAVLQKTDLYHLKQQKDISSANQSSLCFCKG